MFSLNKVGLSSKNTRGRGEFFILIIIVLI